MSKKEESVEEKVNTILHSFRRALEIIQTDTISDGREKVLSVNELGIVTAIDKYPDNVVSIFKNKG